MSKAVNILEVLEKAHQSSASVSKRNKQANFFSSLVGSFANIVCEPKGRGYTEHYAPVRFVEPAKPGEIKKVKIVDNKIDFVFVEH